MTTEFLDRNLALEAVRITEAAALSSSLHMGRGDEKAADQAAVNAMREFLNNLSISGTIIIGEGERDKAPMLYIGEKVGLGGPKVDIALDPLEGTTITAKGGENFITIGNFQKNSFTKKSILSKNEKNNISYYYLDTVSVELNNKPITNYTRTFQLVDEKENEITQMNEIELNRMYKFKNIHFNFNSIKLTQAEKNEVDILYEYLYSNKNTKIIILGHTDYFGSPDYNKALSEKRAKSVADYLIKMGLNKTRIKAFGYGYSLPLSTSKTDDARKKNRRVEFKITEDKI